MSQTPASAPAADKPEEYRTFEETMAAEVKAIHEAMMGLSNALGIEDRRDEESEEDLGHAYMQAGNLAYAVEVLQERMSQEIKKLEAELDAKQEAA